MGYKEIIPGSGLRQYIKCYYIYESASEAAFDDTVYPSGCMEVIFNLGNGIWQTAGIASGRKAAFYALPRIELWGQITRPLLIRSIGKNSMLGIRFFPHAAGCFINEKVDGFNDQVLDFGESSDPAEYSLHQLLLSTKTWSDRIRIVENYLLKTLSLSLSQKRTNRIHVVGDVMKEMRRTDFFDNLDNVAARYGISSRYLQKLFLQYSGLTPKLYTKINRFQNSLRLVGQKDASLTSIAYDCGYFDQSHFIKDFKSFTGLTPSGYSIENSPVTLALNGN